ncbi:MAG TPA: outer membrane lipoprotein-sorting protein [Polyangiaceae bacterium]|nr:outer membrane lipoprotein-sorting protein [Polyangiaceae bacterium]
MLKQNLASIVLAALSVQLASAGVVARAAPGAAAKGPIKPAPNTVAKAPSSPPAKASVQEILSGLIDADPWALGGAVMTARASLKDKHGASSELTFQARSRRYAPPFSKAIVRFTAPADLAGAGFLQVQNQTGDDDRFLFLPDLKRSRRISGNLRGSAFMGTDFSFADLDRRDLRESSSLRKADESIGKFPCFRVDATPSRADSPYSRIEMWIRQDNYMPLKMQMYDRASALFKTFTAQEVRRVSGHWYITKSRMIDHLNSHQTELVIENVAPSTDIPDEEFTVRNLEKL